MSLRNSLNSLNQKIKEFQDIVKKKVFLLSKFDIQVINLNNKTESLKLSFAIYFLRNAISEIVKSKVKLNDFAKLQIVLKRLFQKFLDTPELIKFDKGEDVFKRFNENETISLFNLLFCDLFEEKINNDKFKENCNKLKECLNNFDNFKVKFKDFNYKLENFKILKEKIEYYKKLLENGDLKKLNENNLEDFRFIRSFFPLNNYNNYLIDIKNKKIVNISK